MLDLVEGGSTWDEVVALAQGGRGAPARRSSTPASAGTRRASRPSRRWCRARRSRGSRARLKGEVDDPADHDQPDQRSRRSAEAVLARGDADMVSMARPFLADAGLRRKAAAGRADEINTCIACNQACLDHIFERKIASCLVNPCACRETELTVAPRRAPRKRVAVVGAGPAGLACATTAAERGHASRCSTRPPRSAASSTSRGAFPARRSSPRRCATSARGSRSSASSCALGGACDAERPRGLRRRDRSRPASCRACRRFRGIEHPKVASYVDVVEGAQGRGRDGRDHRRRRHRLRRRRVPDARRRARRARERRRAATIPRSRRSATSGASTRPTRSAAA